jgi:hypothetical protein
MKVPLHPHPADPRYTDRSRDAWPQVLCTYRSATGFTLCSIEVASIPEA